MGRPALLSVECGISGVVDRQGAGLAVRRDPADIALAIERLRRDTIVSRFERARLQRSNSTNLRRFLLTYRELYDQVAVQAKGKRVTASGTIALSRDAASQTVGDVHR